VARRCEREGSIDAAADSIDAAADAAATAICVAAGARQPAGGPGQRARRRAARAARAAFGVAHAAVAVTRAAEVNAYTTDRARALASAVTRAAAAHGPDYAAADAVLTQAASLAVDVLRALGTPGVALWDRLTWRTMQ
jgi:hypothetical protein